MLAFVKVRPNYIFVAIEAMLTKVNFLYLSIARVAFDLPLFTSFVMRLRFSDGVVCAAPVCARYQQI